MARVAVAIAVFLVSSWPAPLFAQRAELAKARTLYNERNYDLAIETAIIARAVNATADAATIVMARAHLERYRRNADPSDLSAARGALSAVRAQMHDVIPFHIDMQHRVRTVHIARIHFAAQRALGIDVRGLGTKANNHIFTARE